MGENGTSWGYGGTAKKSHDNKYINYGDKYGAGDAIVCYIDLESKVSFLLDTRFINLQLFSELFSLLEFRSGSSGLFFGLTFLPGYITTSSNLVPWIANNLCFPSRKLGLPIL